MEPVLARNTRTKGSLGEGSGWPGRRLPDLPGKQSAQAAAYQGGA